MTMNIRSKITLHNDVGTSNSDREPFEAVALDMSDKLVSTINKSKSGSVLDQGQPQAQGRLRPPVSFNFCDEGSSAILQQQHRHKTTGDIDMGSPQLVELGYSNKKKTTRLSVEHRNDKNDVDSSLTFKEFRRSLSILKRSLHVIDDDKDFELDSNSDYGSVYSSDSDESPESQCEDNDDDEDNEGKDEERELLVAEDDDELPSSYAIGTSSRSMMSLTRKTNMPMDVGNKRRKKLNWLKSFYRLDPRWQICNFFDDLAYEGVNGIDEEGRIQNSGLNLPSIMRAFSRVGVFSVWRPTSNEAIHRMITGEGTGKGMDIKGKSAKRGKWSGFVPFLQIHNNEDKLKIGSLHADARVRVFYPNKISRDRAFMSMSMVRDSMVETTQRSMRFINEVEKKEAFILQVEMLKSSQNLSHCSETSMKAAITSTRKRLSTVFDYSKVETALEAKHRNSMIDTEVHKIDDYASSDNGRGCYGMDIPEKLFWETYVSKTDISREDGSEYDTGRASVPEFQVMNLESLRKAPKAGAGPRPVLWHAGCGKIGEEPPQNVNPLCPLGLLMAYEEGDVGARGGKVTPVVSDFDCFLVGTRRVEYRDPMGEQELSMLKWCVDEIEGVLDNAKGKGGGACWTRQWLDVKKKYAFDPRFQIPMPKMGYADPRSSAMMKGAVYSLKGNGAVRHGPECFNYSFPQQLDDKFLVISDTLPGLVPWKYVDIDELKEILAEKIDDGFAFPLNPKWILCDEGWKDLYDKLLASETPNVQDAMNVWYPADVRERIAAISSKHPCGFGSREGHEDKSAEGLALRKVKRRCAQVEYESFNAEIAELELERYKHAKSGVKKLRRALLTSSKAKRKGKKNSLFLNALLMLQIGKEANAPVKRTEDDNGEGEDSGSQKSGIKKLGNTLRRRRTFDSDHTASSFSSVPIDGTVLHQENGKEMLDGRPSRRRSLTNYIRKRLSISGKKK